MQSPFCCVTNRFFVVSFSNDSNKILLLWRNEKACIFKPIGFGKCQLFSHMALSPKLHLLTINSLLLFTIFFYLKRKPFSREKFGATKTAKLVTMLWWPSHWNWFRTLYLSQLFWPIINDRMEQQGYVYLYFQRSGCFIKAVLLVLNLNTIHNSNNKGIKHHHYHHHYHEENVQSWIMSVITDLNIVFVKLPFQYAAESSHC